MDRSMRCGRSHVPGQGVTLKVAGDGAASYGGVQLCGSLWVCAVCSARIRQQRADELETLASAWLAAGHGLLFVTLTMPHRYGQPLRPMLDTVTKGFRALLSGATASAERDVWGLAGSVRALEVTHGGNGWHPHLHVLVFTERPLQAREWSALGKSWHTRWSRYVARAGFGKVARLGIGVRVQPVTRAGGELGRYLSKVQDEADTNRSVGMEMTRGDLKSARRAGRLPFAILGSAADGVAGDVALWHEYELAMKGRRALVYSRGLRAKLGAAAEQTDTDLANEPEAGDVVRVLEPFEWRTILRHDGGRAGILEAVETGGVALVDTLLIRWAKRQRRLDEVPVNLIRDKLGGVVMYDNVSAA